MGIIVFIIKADVQESIKQKSATEERVKLWHKLFLGSAISILIMYSCETIYSITGGVTCAEVSVSMQRYQNNPVGSEGKRSHSSRSVLWSVIHYIAGNRSTGTARGRKEKRDRRDLFELLDDVNLLWFKSVTKRNDQMTLVATLGCKSSCFSTTNKPV